MYCDGSLDEGEYTVEALMLSHVQGESRKTFSCPAGLNDTFLLLDPIFASMRVWFALFLVSDPGYSSLLALCQPFSVLSGSGTHFFCSETRFLLLYGSGSHFFSSQTRGALLFSSGIMSTFFHSMWVRHALFLLWDFAFSFYQPRIPVCLTILHTFFNTASYLFHIYPVS